MSMPERFLIPMPTATDRKVPHPLNKADGSPSDRLLTIYTDAETGEDLMWSADFPLPAVGTEVYITMNGIGPAVVTGYFSSPGGPLVYLGVMTKATKPPKWLVDQRRREGKSATYSNGKPKPQWVLDSIGCEFGSEIALTKPKVKRKPKAEVKA